MMKKQLLLKAIEDYVFGILCIILFFPIFLLVAILVKVTSVGPIFFKEYRRGLHGDLFTIYKFRSFYIDNDCIKNIGKQTQYYNFQPTPIGMYLRKIGLDELPQFLNVIQGKMSIIGPRPNSLKDDEYFSQYIKLFPQRYKIKPGITGWAQINNLKGTTPSVEEMEKRIEYDFYYINNWSLIFDLKIMYLTIKYMYKKITASSLSGS